MSLYFTQLFISYLLYILMLTLHIRLHVYLLHSNIRGLDFWLTFPITFMSYFLEKVLSVRFGTELL